MPLHKQFDPADALRAAELQLWKQGYEGSSMEDLLHAMGIQKGSFYATFRSKHHLLMEALRLYIGQRLAALAELSRATDPLGALRAHLDTVYAESTGRDASLGCFLVNASQELAPRDPEVRALVQATLEQHRDLYRQALDRAVQQGQLPPGENTATLAAGLLSSVLGMRVAARAGMPASTLRSMRDQALSLLQAPA